MANTSILAAFERMWQHVVAALGNKSDISHTHDDKYYTESEIDSKLSGKANASHGNHVPAIETANNAKFLRNDNTWQTVTTANIGAVPTSRTVNGKALSSNISLTASDVGADASGAASGVQVNLNSHTGNKSNPHGVTATQVGAAPASHTHSDTVSKTENSTLNNDISTTWVMYGERKVTVTGNDITFDMSAATGGWAGDFASIKDPVGDKTPMLGVYGGTAGLVWVYMGGTYDDPAMRMTKDGQFTFKNAPNVGSTPLGLAPIVSQTDITAGSTALADGQMYVVYE